MPDSRVGPPSSSFFFISKLTWSVCFFPWYHYFPLVLGWSLEGSQEDELTDKISSSSCVCRFFVASHHDNIWHLFRILVSELLLCTSFYLWPAGCCPARGYEPWREQEWVAEPVLSIFMPPFLNFLHILWWAIIFPTLFPHYLQPEVKSFYLWVLETHLGARALISTVILCVSLDTLMMKVGTAGVKFQGKRDLRS